MVEAGVPNTGLQLHGQQSAPRQLSVHRSLLLHLHVHLHVHLRLALHMPQACGCTMMHACLHLHSHVHLQLDPQCGCTNTKLACNNTHICTSTCISEIVQIICICVGICMGFGTICFQTCTCPILE